MHYDLVYSTKYGLSYNVHIITYYFIKLDLFFDCLGTEDIFEFIN